MAITSNELDVDGWSWTLNSSVWARALGTTQSASPASALTAVTRTFIRLEKRNLITWERIKRSREIKVTLLREDGSGQPYTRPGKDGNTDPYLKLPHAFWKQGHDGQLKLPGLAMLLVASCERPGFKLATERVKDWYGWSADTAERGFKELAAKNLMVIDKKVEKAPEAPAGFTRVNLYTLTAPYAHRSARKTKLRTPSTGASADASSTG
ncbi:hypothetical protein [Streptomyces mangrovi]|uniref:hypothetical protein n=1 Tax=Streptomyces mangrovi TaxID=1206892 RepID=UPI00399D0479